MRNLYLLNVRSISLVLQRISLTVQLPFNFFTHPNSLPLELLTLVKSTSSVVLVSVSSLFSLYTNTLLFMKSYWLRMLPISSRSGKVRVTRWFPSREKVQVRTEVDNWKDFTEIVRGVKSMMGRSKKKEKVLDLKRENIWVINIQNEWIVN